MKMEITEIEIEKIKTNPNQPRKEFDKEKLQELAASIKESGLINPIQVKKIDDKYELVCGERRLRAYKLLKLKKISAIVKNYNSKSDGMIESLIENLHRDNLTSVEKENFIYTLWKTGKYKTKRELANAIGLNSAVISANLTARETRKETKAAKEISTRILQDINPLKTEDKKKIIKKLEKKEINSDNVREIARVIKNSPTEVKKAYFSDKISIKQADTISKVTDEKMRNKMIKAHKEIKSIDKSIETNIKKLKPNKQSKLIQAKEKIDNFRSNSIEHQRVTQATIKSLINCISYVSLMDDTQIKRLNKFQDLFYTSLTNSIELLDTLKEKIK
jgi:ParB family transcriptional regulator, chromosome partitioning protein